MDHFTYRDGSLFCEDIPLRDLAVETGTPAYVYSAATLALHYDRLAAAFADLRPLICYSVKSCSNINLLRLLVARGAGMDVVSGGELHRARLAGTPPSKIVYAGVGKTDDEIRDALGGIAAAGASGRERTPIGLFNIESEPEFETIAALARSMQVTAKAALRVNPDVDPHTPHAYTATGKKESKFGVDIAHARTLIQRFAREKHLRLTGIHLHLGSPISDTRVYVEAIRKTLALMDELDQAGLRVETLDLGGGFAADYRTGASPAATDYAAAITPLLKDRVGAGLKIILEPGRTISANAGVLLTRVLYVKHSGVKKFAIVDAGMHTLIRPALYGAFHFIWPVTVAPQHVPAERTEKPNLPGLETCDVVGPVCESGDFLAKDRPLPPVARGDLVAVFGAGAYGMTMASRYNSHPLPAEVLIEGARATLIRRRETLDDLVRHETQPEDVTP